MKILNLCDSDYAGVGIALTRAVNRHTDHQARHICMVLHPFGYDHDIQTRDPQEVTKWVEWADVVNCYCNFRPLRQGNSSQLRPEHLIITYLGRHYRRHHWQCHISAKRAGATKSLCSSPDLSRFGGAEWLPVPIPADRYAKKRRTHQGKPVVCQTPSEPNRRSATDEIRRIFGRRSDVRLVIATGVQHEEALRRKAGADVFIDRFEIGLGLSGLEALAMGIPTIADALPDEEEWILKAVGYLPYWKASVAELESAVDRLLSDQALYNEYAERGLAYIKKFHDSPVVAGRYVDICRQVVSK